MATHIGRNAKIFVGDDLDHLAVIQKLDMSVVTAKARQCGMTNYTRISYGHIMHLIKVHTRN